MDKLGGIKAGDKVRVTFEASVKSVSRGSFSATVVGKGCAETLFDQEDVNALTFTVEKIEPPISVGEMVTWGMGVETYELVAIKGRAAILWGAYDVKSVDYDSLRKAEA